MGIPGLASCVLPASGGTATSSQEDFRFEQLFKVAFVRTQIDSGRGERADKGRITIQVELHQCEFLGVVRIDRIQTILETRFSNDTELPYFSARGTTLEGFEIHGSRAAVEFNQDLFWKERRYDDFVYLRDPSALFRFEDPRAGEPVVSSLISRLELDSREGVTAIGNAIHVPGFGRIRLAEVEIEPQRFSLTMFRIDLGSEVLGEINLATAICYGVPRNVASESDFTEAGASDISTGLDDEEESEVIDELRHWLNTNPNPDQPFLFFMGRNLTPEKFFDAVERRTARPAIFAIPGGAVAHI